MLLFIYSQCVICLIIFEFFLVSIKIIKLEFFFEFFFPTHSVRFKTSTKRFIKKVFKKKTNTKKYFTTKLLHQSIPSVNFIYVQVSLLKRQRDLNLPNLRIITQTTPIFKSSRSPFIVSSLYI